MDESSVMASPQIDSRLENYCNKTPQERLAVLVKTVSLSTEEASVLGQAGAPVIDPRHELYGQNIKGKVFVFPEGRGSTVGAAVILELVRCGNAPAAIVNRKTEGILAAGGILADKFYNVPIPIVDDLNCDPITEIKTGDWVVVDASSGSVIVGK